MQERLNRLYEQYGYRKFKMSRFEDYDLYAQNRDFLRQDRIITFTDADGALKALKPDITLSIMKSNGGDSEKVYYNENVCREVGGAFREILQVGVESVGQIDPYAEAEVIALAARSLEQELTFEQASAFFRSRNVAFGPTQMRTLHLIGPDGTILARNYTNAFYRAKKILDKELGGTAAE